MTPDLISVDAGWTVREVLDYVRENGQDSETLNVIYVVDDRGKLVDDIRIREFLLKPLDTRVSDFMDKSFTALNVTDSQEEAVNVFRKYDRAALPGADSGGGPVGPGARGDGDVRITATRRCSYRGRRAASGGGRTGRGSSARQRPTSAR